MFAQPVIRGDPVHNGLVPLVITFTRVEPTDGELHDRSEMVCPQPNRSYSYDAAAPQEKGVSEKKPDLFSHYYDYNITRIPKVFNGALKCSKVF